MNSIVPYSSEWWTAVSALGSIITAIATILLFIATIAQVFVTRLIAKELRSAAVAQEKQANSRYINTQWQRINLSAITDKNFREVYSEVLEAGLPEAAIRTRGLIFYILNMMYDMYNADGDNIDQEFYKSMLHDHIHLLCRTNKSDLITILDTNRGYSPDFCKRIHEIIAQIEKRSPGI